MFSAVPFVSGAGRYGDDLMGIGKGLDDAAPVVDDVVEGMGITVDVNVRKFSEYIFKDGTDHGKDVVFKNLGYGAESSDDLVKLYQEQAAKKFANGDYTLGKLDDYGQRINIEIELPGIGNAAGNTSYLKSGWMILEDGSIKLNTPFTGFTK